jgi:CBS domain-containing protein
MSTVRDILTDKGTQIWGVSPKSSVFEALNIMLEKDIGALLVIDNEKLIGIFSERDYARKGILKGRLSKETSVSELMSRHVFYVQPEDTIEACMGLMTDKRIRHLPVMDNGRLAGMITIGDVVKRVISNQKFIIRELQNYISGTGY